MRTIETFNKFFVDSRCGGVTFLRPVPRDLSRPDAILLAAWLVAMAEDDLEPETTFATVLEALQRS